MTSTNDELVRFRAFLTEARATCCTELFALPQIIRDSHTLGVQINLKLSIRCCDVGPDQALRDSGYALATTRVGRLLQDAGYAANEWLGSLPEVERQLADRAKKQAVAEAVVAESLLTDDERAARDADAKARRDALNALFLKLSPDGRTVVAYKSKAAFVNDEPYLPEDMSEVEAKAFAQLVATHR